MTSYDVGDMATLTATFKRSGTPTDPSTVKLTIQSPTGAKTIVTGGFSHPSTGVYAQDLSITESGTWVYQWIGTGVAQAMEEGSIDVRVPRIT